MKIIIAGFVAGILSLATSAFAATPPPQPYGPVPSERQLKWHEMEFYGFLHFTVNTFTDKEWGYGDENEDVFNPTAFDADQIVRSCKAAGMKELILTCKHHDGFCLWPSKYTEHSVKNSAWKGGKGDVVKEISDACRKNGLKFGVYLSPWDRNHRDYGKPEYIEYYRKQMTELLTNYGPISEVWLDGANGGDGYYGGTRETRRIDRRTYYDWDNTISIIRKLQPDACIFSDAGPDVRWVGNERGVAGDPCWATLNKNDFSPGDADTKRLNTGDRKGSHWVPAETDVSIRPGWFYHAKQDGNVRSPENLRKIYFESVGRGASLLLNVPPDRRGLAHENDVKSLAEFGNWMKKTFGTDLARGAAISASSIRGNDAAFGPKHLIDGNRDTYWATDDKSTTPGVTLEFKKPITFNVVRLREFLPLGQRVDTWEIDAWQNGKWTDLANGTAIGACRLVKTSDPVTTEKVRLRITKSPVCPAISEFGLFLDPNTTGNP